VQVLGPAFAQALHRETPVDVCSIVECAISAIVDVKLVTATLLYLDDQRIVFSGQRSARLAPQFRRIRNRERFRRAVDHVEIVLKRRRFHTRIDRREATTDIDDVNRDRRIHNRRTDALQSLHIGKRGHRLAANMEANAQPVSNLTRCLQQGRCIGQIDAELGREAQLRILGRYAQTHAQAQIGSGFTGFVSRGGNDLFQFLVRVEAEGPHAVREISFTDGAGGLHRMHEAQRRFGQRSTDEAHFRD